MYYYIEHTSRFNCNTGIQRCVRSIARALIRIGIPLRPLVWDRQRSDFCAASAADLNHLERWNGPKIESWAESRLRLEVNESHVTDNWLLIVELVSGPYQPSLPEIKKASNRLSLSVAWVFHDAIPLRFSQLYGARSAVTASHHAKYMAGLSQFEIVLANSYTTSIHLKTFLSKNKLPYSHVKALPLACELMGVERCDIPTRFEEGEIVDLLCVSSLEPRKNHLGLLKAISTLAAKERFPARLTLVGWGNDQRTINIVERAVEIDLPIRWENNVDDNSLVQLYRSSKLTIYPSLEEGFGLPVAESLWQRRPCICSRDGALGELSVKGGCLGINTSNWYEIEGAIERFLHDESLQVQLYKEVSLRPTRSWHTYSLEMCELLGIEL
ncbi:glycosyltransferase [Prochlorococcus sp. MIT 1300]|uniref:glycosyltransferase n=1 Tax=Prochlorococcus sp. MIT 1300 TaxID=3096218 RepID=UPI002A7475A1|nr:glycosyltransferase [Prochlorococcus sp. MIT 1300]